MKNLSLLAVTLFISAAASAQTTVTSTTNVDASTTTTATTPNPAIKPEMKVLRTDMRAYRSDKAIAAADVKAGNLTGAQTEIAAAATEKADIKTDVTTLKADGVEHPLKRADKQIDRTDEKKLGTAVTAYNTDKVTATADIKSGKLTAAGTEVTDMKAARAAIRQDVKIAHRDGISHPFHHLK